MSVPDFKTESVQVEKFSPESDLFDSDEVIFGSWHLLFAISQGNILFTSINNFFQTPNNGTLLQ